MDLAAYLSRIGYEAQVRPDLHTLLGLHDRHMLAIPYENLDVQLGRRLTLDPGKAFDKLVTRRRGGWCYEMNGVFAGALEAAGFQVTRMAGEVMRDERNPGALGGHLALRVNLDGAAWLCDVGFGDGLKAPIPLAEGEYEQSGHTYRLERRSVGWWRFHNHADASGSYFDFMDGEADPAIFAAACKRQQTSPTSVFVQNLVAQRHTRHGVSILIGRVLHRAESGPKTVTILKSAEELTAALAVEFGIELPEAARLWPKVCARHTELFPA